MVINAHLTGQMCDIWNDEVRQCLGYSLIQPALSITSGQIPTTGIKEELKYSGRSHSFDMSNTAPKQLLEHKLSY